MADSYKKNTQDSQTIRPYMSSWMHSVNDQEIHTIDTRHEPFMCKDSMISNHDAVVYDDKPTPLESLLKVIQPTVDNPIHGMGMIKKLFFAWINPLFNRGSKNSLQPSDLYKITNKAQDQNKVYEKTKMGYLKSKLHPMEIAYKAIRCKYWMAAILFVFGAVTQMVGPLLFNIYFQEFSKEDREKNPSLQMPFLMVGLIALDLFLRSILMNQAMYHINALGSQLAVMIRCQIYEKLTRSSILNRQEEAVSSISSLLTTDIDNLVNGLMITPLFIGAAGVLCVQFFFLSYMGYLTWAMVFMVVMVFVIFYKIYTYTKDSRTQLLKCTDTIAKIMKEFVLNIVNVKINRFEEVFYNRLIKVKEIESAAFKRFMRWSITSSVLSYIFPTVFGLLFFGLSTWFYQTEAQRSMTETYIVLTMLSVMRTPLAMINDAFDRYPGYGAATHRIKDFLSWTTDKNNAAKPSSSIPNGTIVFENASFRLPELKSKIIPGKINSNIKIHPNLATSGQPGILKGIDASFEPGSKTAIVGPGKSGKSFILLSILNETDLTYGNVICKGKTVYIPSAACFTEDSIFQNIVCARRYDSDRYEEILDMCHLRDALDNLEGQEHYILRDNASNLSQNIKKKIILARMLYQDYDIYLIDSFFDDLNIMILAQIYDGKAYC